jgi:hypothetical protein
MVKTSDPLTEHDLQKGRGGKLVLSMPRLTNTDYLDIHHKLRACWLSQPHQMLFAMLEPHEQWSLHYYFKPACDMTDAELLEHRKSITAEYSSLPHRAGRAFAQLCRINEELARRQTEARDGSGRQTQPSDPPRVYGLVRPEVDVEMLARVLVEMAKRM